MMLVHLQRPHAITSTDATVVVHWYPKMGVVKESGRGQLKIFPHTYISPPTTYAPAEYFFLKLDPNTEIWKKYLLATYISEIFIRIDIICMPDNNSYLIL